MIKDNVLNSFAGKNVIVTGGTGLIGRQVVDLLTDTGAHVRVISLDQLQINKKAEYIWGDLTDFSFCKEVTKGFDFVFHLAGIKGSAEVTEKKLASHFVPTMMMNINTLEACRINKIQKVVYTSSIGAYSPTEIFREAEYKLDSSPMDFAGWAKRMAELQIYAYTAQYGLKNFSIVRPCNVYGPGDNFDPENAMVIPSLLHRIFIKETPLLIWGDGSAIRDFAFSKDVAEGVILALFHGTAGKFVNLGSGEGYTIKQLVETLQSFIDIDYEFDPTKPSGFPKRIMDISLAREMIDYNPSTSLEDGLKITWQWYNANNNEHLKRKNYFLDKDV